MSLYSFNYQDTCITSLQISGTLVTVNKLFRNLPVRKNYLNSGRRAADELKRADNVAKSLAVIHPGLRVTFCHNKCLLWQKVACTSLKQSLMQVAGFLVSNNLEELMLREMEASVQILLIYLLTSESNIVIY
jgi:DNA mismatch repair protein PMS1